jgi:hypothetical protein
VRLFQNEVFELRVPAHILEEIDQVKVMLYASVIGGTQQQNLPFGIELLDQRGCVGMVLVEVLMALRRNS